MPLRLSDRTSNSKALATISRLVFRRVNLRAFRTKSSSSSMLVLPMATSIHQFQTIVCMVEDNYACLLRIFAGIQAATKRSESGYLYARPETAMSNVKIVLWFTWFLATSWFGRLGVVPGRSAVSSV